MKAPKLLKNESFVSFRKRVAMWEKKTGKTYPRSKRISMHGSVEDRILDGGIQMTGITPKTDYSKDYNLDDEAKELSLDPSNNKRWRESEEGVKFSREQLAIQQNVEDAAKEEAYAKAVKGNKNLEESIGKNVDSLTNQVTAVKEGIPPDGKDEVKSNVDIGLKPSHYTGKASEDNASSSSPNTYKRMNPIERENRKRFGDEKIDALKIRHADWKKARKAGTLDQWRKKYGVN